MQFSKATVLAIAPFLVGTSVAVPVTTPESMLPHDQVNDVIKHLDSNGQIKWTQVEGGRVTAITHDQGLEAAKAISRRDQATTPGGWFSSHGWKSVGELDGHSTKTSCIGSGNKIASSLVSSGASTACNTFFGKSVAGVAIDNGWNVFQQTGLADVSGANAYINWRWGNLGSIDNVPLTETLCTQAINELLSGTCVGGGTTQGGSIEVAESLGWILGFDPNSA